MGRNIVETLMGAVVLFVAAAFILVSYNSGNISSASNGYKITAKFREIGSLSIGSDVRLGGIKIGSVSDHSLAPSSYMAIVEISIMEGIRLPKDSSASIVGDGLMGGKYLAIEPGGDDSYISQGGEIKFTQDAVSLEELIGKFAFGSIEKPGAGVSEDSF